MVRSRAVALGLGLALCAGAGLVLAQDVVVPPPPPGYAPGGQAAPGPAAAPTAPVIALGGEAPPPEETAPAEPAFADGNATAEPLPSPPVRKGEPLKRPRFSSAILQAVDKTTAETLRFEAKVGEPVRYKGLVMTVHACEQTASDETYSDSIAHLDVQAQFEGRGRQSMREVYRGWMFADTPGLHPLQHPLYDVWLITCKTPAPAAAAAASPAPSKPAAGAKL